MPFDIGSYDLFDDSFSENTDVPSTYYLMYVGMPVDLIHVYERLINDIKSCFSLNWIIPGYIAHSRDILLYGRITKERATIWLIWFAVPNNDSLISQILDLLYRDYLIDVKDYVKVFVCSIDENGRYEQIL